MKIKKYFVIPLLAFLASSCQDEEQASIQPATGDEVRFGASLEQNATARTIYGPEANNAFPIYWVNGDRVLVYSPQCVPVTNAIYQVSAGENQNYATSLDKTGENGLQWGDSPTADFYSVYPAVNVGDQDPSGAEIKDDKVVLTMPTQQDNGYVKNADGTLTVQPDMRACFMVAHKNATSGNVVDLQYTPLSTAVRFTLQGPQQGYDPIGINYVRLYAPEGTYINGTFEADFSNLDSYGLPTLTAIEGRHYVTFNVADVHGTYLTLAPGENIELNAFLLLRGETTITSEWYIEVGTSYGQSFIKNLDDADANTTLVPGKIHRLKGTLPPLTPEAWDPANWMANLQRNVYLSEISIPGAWYSMHEAYQPETNNISSLYQKGIRAFHLDTRWRGEKTIFGTLSGDPIDLGVVDTDNHTFYEHGVGLKGDKYLSTEAPTFESVLDEIVLPSNLKKDEYMVVICTFAQGSGNYEYESGKVWIHKISEICNQEKYNDKVIEASKLNANSTVADVLGRVIVIVNTYTETPVNDSKCFFMDIPISQSADVFTSGNYYKVPLKYNNQKASNITVYGTHAQRTNEDSNGSDDNNEDGYVPTLSQRKSMAGEILDESKANYDASGKGKHDIWMYLGMGGYIRRATGGDDYTTVKDELNEFIGDRIEAMYSSNSFYPIGIVLMNDIASSNTSAGYGLAQRILEMNNMYRKAYDPNRSPVDGKPIDGSEGNNVQSAAPGYSSGMKDNGTNAIGWTRVR